jgi:hypothetical protein
VFPSVTPHVQAMTVGSFIVPSPAQSFAEAVPLVNDALAPAFRVTPARHYAALRQRKLVENCLQLNLRSGFLTQHSGTATRLSSSGNPRRKPNTPPYFCPKKSHGFLGTPWVTSPFFWRSLSFSQRPFQLYPDACRKASCLAPRLSPALPYLFSGTRREV